MARAYSSMVRMLSGASFHQELDAVAPPQFRDQRRHLLHRRVERPRLRDLRADVHLHAADAQVFHLRDGGIHLRHAADADAKLVFVFAGRDVLVRVGLDVGVHPDGDRRDLAHLARDFVDELQLRLGLDVEAVNPLLQRVADLLPGLADAREGAFRRVAAGLQHAEKLAAGDDVEPRAPLREQVEHGDVRVCLHGVADEVVQLLQRAVEPREVVADGAGAIDIDGRARPIDDVLDAHVLTEKAALAVFEEMHGGKAAGTNEMKSPAKCNRFRGRTGWEMTGDE
jgi:hypothetical protein